MVWEAISDIHSNKTNTVDTEMPLSDLRVSISFGVVSSKTYALYFSPYLPSGLLFTYTFNENIHQVRGV